MPTIVETRRGPVEVLATGEGPVVITLHGAMGGCDQSLLLARTVGPEGYRYLSISRPGYLGTPLSSGRSPGDQADLLADLLDELGIARAAVLCVSGGGPAALQLAVRHRDRCWALVAVSTCGGPISEKIPLSFHLMMALVRQPWFTDRLRRKAMGDLDAVARRSIEDPADRARLLADPEAAPLFRALSLSTYDRMAERVEGTRNDIETTRRASYPLEEIRTPTLVVHGTLDKLVPYEKHGRVLAARIPGAELLTIEGGEHVAIFTHREIARARVTRFLAQHAPR